MQLLENIKLASGIPDNMGIISDKLIMKFLEDIIFSTQLVDMLEYLCIDRMLAVGGSVGIIQSEHLICDLRGEWTARGEIVAVQCGIIDQG